MDVFVSYSRRDLDFTRIAVQRLKEAGHEVWVDWEDIPYSSDWWKEITRGMDSCQVVVVIVTPDSLRSDVCNKEITYARGSNKRLVPVLHRDINEPEMVSYWAEQKWEKDANLNWETVRAHNWLFCRSESEYELAFNSLLDTIARDPENTHYHTRLLVRAREWQNSDRQGKKRDDGLLLRGEDLRQAESWLQFNRNQEPRPTPLHSIYIGASAALRADEETLAITQQMRLRRLVAGLSVLLVFALLSGIFAVNRSQLAERSAMTAIYAESQSQAIAATAQVNLFEAWEAQSLYRADRAQNEMDQKRPQGALLLALESLGNLDAGIYNSSSQVALTRAITSEVQETAYFPHDSAVNLAVWSADRQRVATIAAFTISVWSATDSSLIARLNHSNTTFVKGVAFSSDGERLLSWDGEGVVRLWHITSDEPPLVLCHLSGTLVNSAQFSPDETRILTASDDDTAVLWDAQTGDALSVLQHDDGVTGASFSADGRRALTWSRDRTVRVWDISGAQATPLVVLSHDAAVRGAVFNSDHSRVLSWTRGQNAYLWLLSSPEQPLFTYLHGDQVTSASFNRNEALVLTASTDGSANLWSTINGDMELSLLHDSGVDSAVFSGDERQIITVTSKHDVRVWRLSAPDSPAVILQDAAVQRVIPNGDVTRMLTWSDDTAKLWLLEQDSIQALEMRHGGEIYGAVWDEGARRVLTWGDDGTARLWRIGSSGEPRAFLEAGRTTGAVLDPLRNRLASWATNTVTVRSIVNPLEQPASFAHPTDIEGVAWSSDGKWLATWTDGGTQVWVWSVERPTDAPLQLIHTRRISGVVWNNDGTVLVTWDIGGVGTLAASGSTVTVWTLTTPEDGPTQGAQRLVLPHNGVVNGVLVSPDSTLLVTWGGTEAILWSLTGAPKLVLPQDGMVSGAQFDDTGARLLTWSSDNNVRLWNTQTGQTAQVLAHDASVSGARFSQSGNQILTWGLDASVRIWSAINGAQLARLNHEITLQGQRFPLAVIDARWNVGETYVLTLAIDGQARVWRLDGSGTFVLLAHQGGYLIREALWSDDGRRILTWDETDAARVWDIDNRYRTVVLRQPNGLRGASWTTDPQRVLTWAEDGARLWMVDIQGMIEIGESQRIRELSNSERAQLVLPTYTPSPTIDVPTQTPMPTQTPHATVTPPPTLSG